MSEPHHATGANPTPLRLHIDLSGHEYWFQREMETMVESISRTPTPEVVLVDNRPSADCVLRIGGGTELSGPVSAAFRWPKPKSPREFIWDMSDSPTGSLPGFYASLPAYMYDRRRHRAFGLPVRCNEVIQPYHLGDAKFLYGFFGAVTSGVRGRMIPTLNAINSTGEGLLEVRDSIWKQMWDRSGLKAKHDYAENLRQCRFNLCPRGSVLAGAGSRLYETMQAARVPVLISDWITLPEGIDWDSCSVRVRERDVPKIPQILSGYNDRWEQMAANARRNWEEHFSEAAILGEIGRQLRALLEWDEDERMSTKLSGRGRIALGLMAWKPRQYYLNAQQRRAKRRNRDNKS